MSTKAVQLKTNMGSIAVELDLDSAPVTTENFLKYVEESFYDGTIFHRIIDNFMIQGGGFTSDMHQKPARDPIANEADNGLKNDRGTIAMARTSDPNSATTQFFINHTDNAFLDYSGSGNPGYAVFGKVTEGLEIVDAIASVKTDPSDAPEEIVTIDSIKIIDDNQ